MKNLEQFAPTLRRWTVEECENLSTLGVLSGRYELIEGMINDKMGSGGRHSKLVRALMSALLQRFGDKRVCVQLPIRILGELGRYNEPEPDVCVTKEGYAEYDENPLPEDLLLVAEVSDSSLDYDMTTKANLYARVGIPEYWIVDAEGERLLVHRQPTNEGYAAVTVLQAGDTVAPLSRLNGILPVVDLFPKAGA